MTYFNVSILLVQPVTRYSKVILGARFDKIICVDAVLR